MTEAIRLTVAEGRRVRMPDGTLLAEGTEHALDPTPFVLRRIRAGDLVPPPVKPARTASKKD